MAQIKLEWLLGMKEQNWPQVTFYDREVELMASAIRDLETYCVAANKMGKDFTCGFLGLGCFLVCQAQDIQCRIVTTSVKEKHLDILWGEIGWFIANSKRPLMMEQGGPLFVTSKEIRRVEEREATKGNVNNYLVGLVAEGAEGLSGHHAKDGFTMLIGDEASGMSNLAYEASQGWAKHKVFIGNPFPTNNFFKRGVEAGDLMEPDNPLIVGAA